MDPALLDALSRGLALLELRFCGAMEKVEAEVSRVARAIEHHQLSVQSVWEGVDSIETAIAQLVEIAERYDSRDEEQFRWRVEARIQKSDTTTPAAVEELRKALR